MDTEIRCFQEAGGGKWNDGKLGREFKVEAVRLIKERGVAAAQAARDLDVHENVLRKWVKEWRCGRRRGIDDAVGIQSFGEVARLNELLSEA